MTINEAIQKIDALKRNTYKQDDKIVWLSRLDAMVKKMIVDTHEGGEGVVFNGYNDKTDRNTQLLIDEPFDDCYLHWMEAQIDYNNGEYVKYNNSIDTFYAVYDEYKNYYNRTHMPIGKSMKFF